MYTLLTGATGFIGQELQKITHPFMCVSRNKSIKSIHPTFYINNLDSKTNWNGAFVNVNNIIHLAGLAHNNSYTEDDYRSVNLSGTLKLAEEAAKKGVRRFVFVSSITVNGRSSSNSPFTPKSTPSPQTPYAQSKLSTELGLKKISDETGMEIVIVRPPLVYGANAPGNIDKLIKLIKKSPFLPFGLVNNKRSFIHVKSLAEFLIECTKEPKAANNTFLPSDSTDISTKEFTTIISKYLGRNTYQLSIPPAILKLGLFLINKKDMASQLLDNMQVDKQHIQGKIEWTPTPPNIF